VVEAYCPHDQIPEAIRFEGNAYIAAVQWHPEFHTSALGTLDDSPILTDFLNAARSKQSV
jgi:putative glutamine amidotransferase